jgi:hypothetical protein
VILDDDPPVRRLSTRFFLSHTTRPSAGPSLLQANITSAGFGVVGIPSSQTRWRSAAGGVTPRSYWDIPQTFEALYLIRPLSVPVKRGGSSFCSETDGH